jgi:uncharacterized membrane protein YdbT with pleckstrin-like domain
MEPEQTLWKGTPSQVLHLPSLLLGLLFAGALTAAILLTAFVTGPIALAAAAAAWFVCLLPWMCKAIATRFDNYELTSERLHHRSGVLNRKIEVLELYRVKDMRLEMPLLFRIFGLSRIILETSDRSTPLVKLNGIAGGLALADLVRKNVETMRDRKRVREVDYESDDDFAA